MPYLRAAILISMLVVLVAVLGAGAALLLIDPNGIKPEIIEAARRATGRELRMSGPIHIALGLPPTLVAEDVALANVPGGSRPDMMKVERIELRVGLLSWLTRPLDVIQLTLVHPDLLFETDATGKGNWDMARVAAAHPTGTPAADVADSAAPAPQRPAATRFAVHSIHIREMRVTWHSGSTGVTASWAVPSLTAEAEEAGHSMLLNGRIVSGARTATVSGETGPIGRLLDNAATVAWPLQVTMETEGARLAVRGTLHDPTYGGGYALQMNANVTDLSPFAVLLPSPPPRLQEATLAARVSAVGNAAATLDAISLHAGNVQVPSVLPGVDMKRIDVSAPGRDQPARLDVAGASGGTPLHLTASIGTLAATLAGDASQHQIPVEFALEAADALFTAKGTVRSLFGASGLDLDVLARVPSLAALGPLVQRPLPPLQQLALNAHVGGALLAGGIVEVSQIRASLPQADVTGDLKVTLGTKPAMRGTLAAQQIDLDGLLEILRATSAAPAAKPPPGEKPPPTAAAPVAEISTWLIPNQPLPLAWLDQADADLHLSVAALHSNGVGYSNLAAHLVVQDGKLTLDPAGGDTPGGKLTAQMSLDSRAAKPPISVMLHAPAMALQPLAAAVGDGDVVSGSASVDADLHGSGGTLHEIAATLSGHLSLALSNGDMDNSLLTRALADVLKASKLPDAIAGNAGGRTKVRCLVARLDVVDGKASITALALDTPRLQMEGSGTLNLGDEQLALRLRPTLRTGPGIVVPATVTGSFLNPRVALDPSGMPKGDLLGAVAGLVAPEHGGDVCAAATAAAARGGAAAAVTAPVAPPVPAPTAKPPKPIDVLRRLLH